MDIYSYLKKDHQKVSDLLDDILASKDQDQREALLEEVKQELLLHAETENATFYAALKKKKETAEDIEEAVEEHDEIKEYLSKLDKLPIESEEWIEQFGEFKHCVTHHVKEEEGEIFKHAKKVLSAAQAKELAAEMDALKKKKLKMAA